MNRFLGFKCLFFIVFVAFFGVLPERAVALGPDDQEELVKALNGVLKEHNTPALGIAVYDSKTGAWSTAVGMASVKEQRQATAKTAFRLGSVSKSFVALTAMRLEEQGKLDLQAKFGEKGGGGVHLKNPFGEPAKLVHLLEHTAGLDDLQFAEYAYKKEGISLEEAFAFTGSTRELRWTPGETMSYSNAGPALVAYAIEQNGEKSFEAYSRELVLDPLEMRATGWGPRELMADGYQGDGDEPVTYAHIIFRPSGALNATPEDMTHLLEFMVNEGRYGGKQLVSVERMRRMRVAKTTLAASAGLDVGYGLGSQTFFSEQGHVLYGHGGAIDGFVSRYEYVPGRYGWAVLSNKQDSAGLKAALKVLRNHFLPERPDSEPPRVEVQLNDLEGYFVQRRNRMEMMRFVSDLMGVTRVSVEDGAFLLSPVLGGSEGVRLLPVKESEHAVFFRGEDEVLASYVFFKGEGHYQHMGMSFHKAASWVVWGKLIAFALAFLWFALGIVACLVWAFKWWRKTLSEPRLTAVATLTIVSFWAWITSLLVPSFASDPLVALGNMSLYSLAIFFGSTLFAVMTGILTGMVVQMLRQRQRVGVFVLALNLFSMWVVVYAMAYGWIGLTIWSL